MQKIVMNVEKTATGFSAYAQDFDVATTAPDWSTLITNMLEALNLYFENEGFTILLEDLDINMEVSAVGLI